MDAEPPMNAEPPVDAEPPTFSPELLFGASYVQREDKRLTEDEVDNYLLAVVFRRSSA